MSLISLILMVGFTAGTGEESKFDPEGIGMMLSKYLIIWFIETGVFKLSFMCIGVNDCPFLQLLCITGYKFVSIVIAYLLMIAFGKWIGYSLGLILGFLMMIFVIKTLKRFTHHNTMASMMNSVPKNRISLLWILGMI